ncbi:MAG TPA: ABC transporter C-terminal domain-containing protein, partial [Solirubrobacteraceae bacterium]
RAKTPLAATGALPGKDKDKDRDKATGGGNRSQAPGKRTPPTPKAKARTSNGQRGLEAEIDAAEVALRAVEDALSDPSAWATPEVTARSTARHEAARQRVAELYSRWEAVAG